MITQDRKLDDIKYSVKTRKKKTEERKETDASNRIAEYLSHKSI